MAKKKITPLELAEEYLSGHLRIDKRYVHRNLLPALFEVDFICKRIPKQDLIPKNKNRDKFKQTHIFINKGFWSGFSTPAEVSHYQSITPNSDYLYKEKTIRVFESNIYDLLERRKRRLSKDITYANPENNYYASSQTKILDTHTKRGFYTQGGSDQLHIGISDEDIFKDFRLGILLDDLLILLKYVNKDAVLAIAIPSEFCDKYEVIGISQRRASRISRVKSKSEEHNDNKYDDYDGSYSNDANRISTKPAQTYGPLDAPKGRKRKASDKPKYTANPSYGKGAIVKAGYKCEYDSSHNSFISETTGHQYMEPHHLIPISKQGDFNKRIDVTPNLVCLCPNCHKKIHHGKKDEVGRMLKFFFSQRASDLENDAEICIDLETLLAYYDIY